jgi:hypothetical protein
LLDTNKLQKKVNNKEKKQIGFAKTAKGGGATCSPLFLKIQKL